MEIKSSRIEMKIEIEPTIETESRPSLSLLPTSLHNFFGQSDLQCSCFKTDSGGAVFLHTTSKTGPTGSKRCQNVFMIDNVLPLISVPTLVHNALAIAFSSKIKTKPHFSRLCGTELSQGNSFCHFSKAKPSLASICEAKLNYDYQAVSSVQS